MIIICYIIDCEKLEWQQTEISHEISKNENKCCFQETLFLWLKKTPDISYQLLILKVDLKIISETTKWQELLMILLQFLAVLFPVRNGDTIGSILH